MLIHTYAWLVWLISGLVVLTTTRNPLLLILVDFVLVIFQVWISPPGRKSLQMLIRFGGSVLTLSTVLNMLISRFGETILFKLPGTIPLLGGNFTFEALIYGLTNGLVLIGIFTLFMILNQVVSVHSLVRLIPQAFHPVAVVTTIALTFIPASQKQFEAIRDAQAIRGQQLKKIKDWLPLIIPLLIGGLERAMQIAEAMTARGFTAQSNRKISRFEKILLPASLIFIIAGWILELSDSLSFPGYWLIVVGIAFLIILFTISGKSVKKTNYSRELWTPASTWVLISTLLLAVIYILPLPGNSFLTYDPYPVVKLPVFPILHGVFIMMLFMPLMFWKGSSDAQD